MATTQLYQCGGAAAAVCCSVGLAAVKDLSETTPSSCSALTHLPCVSESSTELKGMAAASCPTALGKVVQWRVHDAVCVNWRCTCKATKTVSRFLCRVRQ
jgi:hypothetical protein